MRKFIVGNWKMNGLSSELSEIEAISGLASKYPAVDVGLCVPSTLIDRAAAKVPHLLVGGQDCHMDDSGAHTGCISATMLVDAGAKLTLVGHSERRSAQHETDTDIRSKSLTAFRAGLKVIICVGETLDERDSGQALDIVLEQVRNSVPEEATAAWLSIAYEPVWAIGTGRIPENKDIAEMHGAIRSHLIERFGSAGTNIRILYGGSMNGDNAAMLLAIPHVDGGLIGGASLTAAKFEPIIAAAGKTSE